MMVSFLAGVTKDSGRFEVDFVGEDKSSSIDLLTLVGLHGSGCWFSSL